MIYIPLVSLCEKGDGRFYFEHMEWILASASPRRKQLLAELIPQFEILPAKGEERVPDGCSPRETVEFLARQKAEEICALPNAKGKAVLGADTVVAFGGEILGKPVDKQDAVRMLRLLSGNTHEVFTGVCIGIPNADGTHRFIVSSDCTPVRFFPLTEAYITAYVESGSPMDKAGAYGIQDGGLVEAIDGSFSNVVGLPLELLAKLLEDVK